MRLTVRTQIGPMEFRRYEGTDRTVEALTDGNIVYLKPSFGLVVRNDEPPAPTPRPRRQARRLGAMWQRQKSVQTGRIV
jgi:hypothetical protein